MAYVDLSNIDPNKIPDDQWVLESDNGIGSQTFVHWIDEENGIGIRKTQNWIEQDILDLNQHELNKSQTQKFGDGKVIARIPMNVYYKELVPRLDDADFAKWWLNNDEKKMYRSFRGKV